MTKLLPPSGGGEIPNDPIGSAVPQGVFLPFAPRQWRKTNKATNTTVAINDGKCGK